MAAASIVIDLLMKTGSFETDTQRAGRALQKFSKDAKSASNSVAAEFKRIQDAIAKSGMTASQQKLFDLKQLGASQQQLKAYARNLDELDRKTKSLASSTLSLASSAKAAAGAFGVGIAFTQITNLSDSYTKFTAQLKNATTSAADFGQAYQNVQNIAKSTQFDIEAVGTTYSRLSNATRDLGISQQKVSDIVETIGLSLKTQGATTAEASSAMLQLSQAFGSGRLQGDEFRSAMENVPGLMRELAKSMGVPIGQLKQMSSDGLITADVLVKAFSDPKLLESLREQAKEIRTIGGGYTELWNQIKLVVGETNNATGATSLYAKTLGGVASVIERIRKNGGFDSGFLAAIPGGQAFSVFNQAGRAAANRNQGASGAIKRTPASTNPAPAFQGFDELSKGLSLVSVQMAELKKKEEEVTKSFAGNKITYIQYKELMAGIAKEKESLTKSSTRSTAAIKQEDSALADFARSQQELANILQKANNLGAPSLSAAESLQDELDAYSQLNPAIRDYVQAKILAAKANEQWIDIQEQLAEAQERELEAIIEAQEQQVQFEGSIRDYIDTLERSIDPTIELADNIGKLWSAVSLGIISPEDAERLTKVLEDTSDKNKKVTDEITEFWREAARNMQDAMSDFFFDVMEGDLSDLANNFTRTINRMVADLAAAQFSRYLFGDDFGKGGDIGGLAGDIFSGIGSFFGDFLPSFDVGTPFVQQDMVAKIHKGERILTAQENRQFTAGKMGGTVIQMTVVTPDANSFMKSQKQIMATAQSRLNASQRIR